MPAGFGVWSPWSPCRADCTQKRMRQCEKPSSSSGDCQGEDVETRRCDDDAAACQAGESISFDLFGKEVDGDSRKVEGRAILRPQFPSPREGDAF